MPEQIQGGESEAVRRAFRELSVKHRATFIKKVAPDHPVTMQAVLRAAHVPSTFQLGRIDRWLTPDSDYQSRIENAILAEEHEASFRSLLKGFFCTVHSELNNSLLASINPENPSPRTFREALRYLADERADDPFLDLYSASIQWICKVEIVAQEEAILKSRAVDSLPQSAENSGLSSESSPALTGHLSQMDQLDDALKSVSDAVDAISALQPHSLDPASAMLVKSSQLATELGSQLRDLASKAGEPTPTWADREGFTALWKRFSEIAETKQRTDQQLRTALTEIVRLLDGVSIYHRLPRKQEHFTSLAKQASAELAKNSDAFSALLSAPPASTLELPPAVSRDPARAWLCRAWAQAGDSAEKLHEQLQPISPALAGLLADVNWSDLTWPELPVVHTPDAAAPKPVTSATTQVAAALVQPIESATAPAPLSPPVLPVISHPSQEAQLASSEKSVRPTAEENNSPLTRSTIEEDGKDGYSQATVAEASVATASITQNGAASSPAPAVVSATEAPPELRVSQPVTEVQSPPTAEQSSLASHIWRLASEGRWGLASHLARLDTTGTLPPGWVFEAALLGPLVSYEVSPMSDRLTELFLNAADFRFETLPDGAHQPARLLLAGAALRPALLAPQSNAGSALKLTQLKESLKLPGLDAVVEAVAAFGLHREPLHPAMLRVEHDRAEWDHQIALVRSEIRDWAEKAPHRSFNYAPAARIWREWTHAGGRLRRLLDDTLSAAPESIASLDSAWEPWRTEPGGLVQAAMKEIKQRIEVVGSAREALISRIGEAVDLANKLFALRSQAPRSHASFREEHVRALMTAFRQHAQAAKLEIEKLNVVGSPSSYRAAAALCSQALAGVESLLAGQIPIPGGDEPSPRWVLDAELLRDPSIEFTAEGLVAPLTQSSASKLNALAVSPPDWEVAWAGQTKAENHAATAALLDYLRWLSPKYPSIDELDQRRDRDLTACRHSLEKEADYTRLQLDEFVKLGLCREKDYSNWNALVESAKSEALAETTTQFAPLRARLRQVRAEIKEGREREAKKVRDALDGITQIAPSDRQRILSLLESGDIHTANEYLDLSAHGRPLPQQMGAVQVFPDFFGENGWLPRVESELKQSSMQECWQAARNGIDWSGLPFSSIGQEQRLDVANQLQLWITLERQRRVSDQDLGQLASALGLQTVRATAGVLRPGRVVVQKGDVQADLLDEREASIVAPFGSDAKGRYTFHLVWGELNADDLFTQCKPDTGDTSAHIVLCFRYLFSKDRRELAEVARKRFFKAIVLDRALFAFILANSGSRFATALRTALPFSRINPYTVSAGAVPPEVFYGRRRELESLADPRGSCFVYGGRQLGKTALLRALERRFHQPQSGRAAVFVDLKSELFSRGRSVDELWPLLVAKLKESGVLGEGVGASAGQEALFRHIRDWLDNDLSRRLLLLLDESDTFLEQDGKDSKQHEHFPRCQRLKSLMEATDRRFKVVFAGLHNVQKSTRVSNHPLAHFGEAICVGPMLEEAESREARALVEEPLAAVGYFFENPDAVSRILALTNYYPSLIQIFCHYLLEDLRQNHATRFTNSRIAPPCIITSEHVQRAYGIKVRQAIHEKVNLTLHLDSRYELIAYLLAFYHASDGGAAGLDLRTIRDEAVYYWPKGFEEMRTDDEFRALLEEMIGLGILRQVSSGNRYALRNPNVMMLLGTDEEIARRLEAAKNWEQALRYEADKFRRMVMEKPRQVFSPLTVHSESELRTSENRVAVVYGLAAAGLDDLHSAMESEGLFGKARTVLVRDCADPLTFAKRIASIKREPGHTLTLVPASVTWDESWIMAALKRIEPLTSKDAFLTVLFAADPLRAAAVVPALDGAAEFGLRDFTLRPWHDAAVRRWLQDLNLGDEPSVRKRILDVTGNWPILLGRLATADRSALLTSCDELEARLKLPSELQSLKQAFGVASETQDSPLRVAAESRRCTTEWICEYQGILNPDGIRSVASRLLVGSKLGLVTAIGSEWEFDPIAARILLSV